MWNLWSCDADQICSPSPDEKSYSLDQLSCGKTWSLVGFKSWWLQAASWIRYHLTKRSLKSLSLESNLGPPSNSAIPENREFQKWKFKYFPWKTYIVTSFDIFVITYRVINFLPKLVHMLLFSTEKTKFPFLVFPYFRVMPANSMHLAGTGLRSGPEVKCRVPSSDRNMLC